MLHKVKKLVSLLLGELVCCVVLKRSRTRGFDDRVFHCFGYAGLAFMYPRKEHCEDELKNSTMILNFV
jgi:hypothetical protein